MYKRQVHRLPIYSSSFLMEDKRQTENINSPELSPAKPNDSFDHWYALHRRRTWNQISYWGSRVHTLGSHTSHKRKTLSWSSLGSFLALSSTSSSLFICRVKVLNYFAIPRPSKMNFNYIWSYTLIIPLIINQARSILFTMQLPQCSF